MPAASASERVQVSVASVQLQPVPSIAVAVRPLGSVSTTVTMPLDPPVPVLEARIVYCAPVCPWVKLPAWLFATVMFTISGR